MTVSQIIFGVLIVVVLVGVSGYYGWSNFTQLRALRNQSLPDEEMQWERRKAWRRLISCGLTFVLAVLFVGLLTVYEPEAQKLAEEREAFAQGQAPPFTDPEKNLIRAWLGLVIALLLVLLAVVVLAGTDLWATRRYALRQFRKLQEDRRAMIARQTTRMRQERNGHG